MEPIESIISSGMDRHSEFMQEALAAAREAGRKGEVPVGAVIISPEGELLAKAHNESISRNDPTAHAEILALRMAGKRLSNYRLLGTTFYVTVEPCLMCMGALVQARVTHLVYGVRDPKGGAVDSLYNIAEDPRLNHRMEVSGGVLEKDCREIIRSFFHRLRENQ
ncbi:MAG: tRNA adenosine(34) deaminase TadA [Pseudomonadota bacterium]